MKQPVEKRKPNGVADHLALSLTTFGVGYIPGAPGTYGSALGVGIYMVVVFGVRETIRYFSMFSMPVLPFLAEFPTTLLPVQVTAWIYVAIAVLLGGFCLLGIAASNRSIPLLGNEDPSQAVVDEVMGQLITFCFVPFVIGWPVILAGFLLFRLFDIWKPYPIRAMEVLPGGLGICADDIVAGVYAGICLAVGYAVYLAI
ncbi:MAG: phosphatidylglycerophosphatase A [Pyrinomonadaceae bacterium]